MKKIEAWAVFYKKIYERVFPTETEARNFVGTSKDVCVIKLTGKMPRELRKISTEVWIEPRKANPGSDIIMQRLGIEEWARRETFHCTTRCRITLEELPDE